jgi:sulfane dehydrogenase subunit SoxC
VFAT